MRDDLYAIVAPVVEAVGFICWGVEFRPYGRGRSLLRIYIDHEDGISVDHCETVSREVSRMLDVEDPIRGEYVLEVSSPGLNRRLFFPEQYHHFCGEVVEVKTKRLLDGRKNFKGILKDVSADSIHIQDEGVIYTIPFTDVLTANIVII